ncbi:stalk domain-containing protein [Vermiculatibacterium agrestimuris]|uniref:stalk domain-containing protein n=1 Tax=Vermiculatibacterium agrestimuris TaxID=2941519 RepID=UPI002041C000|nr:stalk domain-containing protein [Vermiculatibacterium agrestimuris]
MGKKRLASMMAVGVLLLAGFAPAGAGQVPSVQVNGMVTEAIPELVQGRAYLPQAELAALLGAQAQRQGENVRLFRDEWEAAVPVTYERDGVAYLPLRAAGAALGYEVGWDREERTVILMEDRCSDARKWSLTQVQTQAGLLSPWVERWARELAETVDPGTPLSAIPLTNAATAAELAAKGAQALTAGEGSFQVGATGVRVLRKAEETVLTVCLPAEELLPAQRLGIAEQEVTLTLTVGEDSAQALATLGEWRACARWTA